LFFSGPAHSKSQTLVGAETTEWAGPLKNKNHNFIRAFSIHRQPRWGLEMDLERETVEIETVPVAAPRSPPR
jgi:hypothetical protein